MDSSVDGLLAVRTVWIDMGELEGNTWCSWPPMSITAISFCIFSLHPGIDIDHPHDADNGSAQVRLHMARGAP